MDTGTKHLHRHILCTYIFTDASTHIIYIDSLNYKGVYMALYTLPESHFFR